MAKPTISEPEAEAMCDRIVMRRLQTDRAYLNAENADDQALAEDEVEDEVWREITDRYTVQR